MPRTSPRPSDVAHWVKTLATEIPSNCGGAALSELRARRRNARERLSSWGLKDDGSPKVTRVIVPMPELRYA